MSAPQSLVQAALNRLGARIGSGLVDTAATLAVIAQDAPGRVQRELQLFWEEVEMEAERIERADDGAAGGAGGAGGGGPAAAPPSGGAANPQQRIDELRARVAHLIRRLEQQPQDLA